jgi:phosphoglycolate phosphatase
MSLPAAVFFDLDGTLVDTAPDFHAIVNRLRADLELAPVDYALVRACVSDGASAVIRAAFPGFSHNEAKLTELRDAFLADYQVSLAQHSSLFDGLPSLLDQLDTLSIRWGVVTNKPSRFTSPLMHGLNLAKRSSATVCADEVSQTKPHPEPMFKAADIAGVNAIDCVYVGDHIRDIEAGRRAGMFTIAAGWGYIHQHDNIEDWGADLICHRVEDLRNWLTTLMQQ